MSRYRGPRFKKIHRLGALRRITNKRPKAEVILETNRVTGKILILYFPRIKTK